MNYIVPIGKNLGYSQFFTWLDKNHPEGSQICWNSLELLSWNAWMSPEEREGKNPPTQDEIWDRFHNIDYDLIKQHLGYESFIELDLNDVFLIVPVRDMLDFRWHSFRHIDLIK
jgi:hypothetical protein